jgi:flagellar hook protein FlgE
MGLQSALSTALTGMTAAETTIDVTGNNVANANTVGFKESHVNFATQFLQTQSIGSAPTDTSGGTNPRQIGLGAKVSEITPKFTQGTIQISANPLDLAIQGDGFFIVEGSQGEHLYTRNGQFKTNANNEIVTITGQRVLGYSVDSNFAIQPTGLTPLQIPLGAAAVAQATENVVMKGALNPDLDDVGTIPEIIQSGVLSDGTKEVPDGSTATLSAQGRPNDTTSPTLGAAPGSIDQGTYEYRVTFLDDSGLNESPASDITSLFIAGPSPANKSIDLNNIPTPPAGYTQMRIYRRNTTSSVPASNDFRLVDQVTAASSYPGDTASDASIAGNLQLNDQGLGNGAYSYYVTFYNSSSQEESRPTARFGPITADATNTPRIWLQNLPLPSNNPATGGYDGIKIYRNLANDPNTFHEVATIPPNGPAGTLNIAAFAAAGEPVSYIDSSPDTGTGGISGNPTINLDGPAISFGLPLVQVVSRNGSNYPNLFQTGELSFEGTKGGRKLEARTLTITNTTTVQELLNFMDESMGVVKTAPESTFPSAGYGGTITPDSRLQFTSNMGIENALGVSQSAFKFTPSGGGATSSIQIPFTTTQEATNGHGATADFVVYDSLGSPLNVRMTTVLESIDSTGARFRWIATSADNVPDTGFSTLVGTGVITTDGNGKFLSSTNDHVVIDRGNSPAISPLDFQVDFSQVTGLSQKDNTLSAGSQDGFPAGTLTSFIITETGRIQGVFSNGSSRDLGQLQMARFANNSGLQQVGQNMYTAGVNSGLPVQGDPGSQGMGQITTGAVELSNTDIGQNLIELILASTQYRGGARVITAVQQLLDELLALRR